MEFLRLRRRNRRDVRMRCLQKSRLRPVAVATILIRLAVADPAAAAIINFDVGAPNDIAYSSPLSTYYSGEGVTFSGLNGAGGSILDQSSNFGIPARSGMDFLAFNLLYIAPDQISDATMEQVIFAHPIDSFAIYVGGGNSYTYTLTAYDADGNYLGSDSVTPAGGVYGLLEISVPNMTYVDFGTPGTAWVADDLSFSTGPVPEPATWAMMLTGLALIGFTIRSTGPYQPAARTLQLSEADQVSC